MEKTAIKQKENGVVKKQTLDEKMEESKRRIKEIEAVYHQEIGKLKAYEEMK